MKKILILKPAYTAQGGISNYYKVLENQFTLPVEYFERGARNWPYRTGNFNEALRALKDLLKFVSKLFSFKYGIVQTSTSLGSLAVIRDGLFVFFAKVFRCKVIVFFRGWDENYEKILEKKYLNIFKYFYFKADSMIVLSSTFKSKLINWGYKKDIFVETTIVDERLLNDVNEQFIKKKYSNLKLLKILFLARVEKAKGIYEAVDTFKILKKEYPKLTFIIAGDGFELEPVKKYVIKNNIDGVECLGHVIGKEKIKAYRESHIYFFPSYSEGMPNSVLEAMAFGLPIIARPVGGLVDILADSRSGYNTLSKDPRDFKKLFDKLLVNTELMQNIAINNFRFANVKFTASQVVKRVERIFNKIME